MRDARGAGSVCPKWNGSGYAFYDARARQNEKNDKNGLDDDEGQEQRQERDSAKVWERPCVN